MKIRAEATQFAKYALGEPGVTLLSLVLRLLRAQSAPEPVTDSAPAAPEPVTKPAPATPSGKKPKNAKAKADEAALIAEMTKRAAA